MGIDSYYPFSTINAQTESVKYLQNYPEVIPTYGLFLWLFIIQNYLFYYFLIDY